MGAVIGALVERRYGVAYRILDAQNFGVAQRRRRVFIVASLGDSGQSPSEILAISESLRGNPKESRTSREEPATNAGESPISGLLSVERVFDQTGFAKYSENEVTTLSATTYKRAEDNVVVREVQEGAE